jgi:hypothetical protein
MTLDGHQPTKLSAEEIRQVNHSMIMSKYNMMRQQILTETEKLIKEIQKVSHKTLKSLKESSRLAMSIYDVQEVNIDKFQISKIVDSAKMIFEKDFKVVYGRC